MVTSHSVLGGDGGLAVGGRLGTHTQPTLVALSLCLGSSGRQLCVRATCREGCPVSDRGEEGGVIHAGSSRRLVWAAKQAFGPWGPLGRMWRSRQKALGRDKRHAIPEDTEQVKGASHIDDRLPRLGLLSRSKLDDLLGCLKKLGHPRPGVPPPGALQAENSLVSDGSLAGTSFACDHPPTWLLSNFLVRPASP